MDCGEDEARILLLSAYHIPLQALLTCVSQATALAAREMYNWIAIHENTTTKRLEENLKKYAGWKAKQFEGIWTSSGGSSIVLLLLFFFLTFRRLSYFYFSWHLMVQLEER
jgi:hypothetical protein